MTSLTSNFFENSLCDYIADLEKKQNKTSGMTDKKILSGRIADARSLLSQTLASGHEHNVQYLLDD